MTEGKLKTYDHFCRRPFFYTHNMYRAVKTLPVDVPTSSGENVELTRYLVRDLLRGTTVFLTGGGSGLNLAIARGFAQAGSNIALCGRSRERLRGAAIQLRPYGVRVITEVAGSGDMDRIATALDRTRREIGPISALVCGPSGNFLKSVAAGPSQPFISTRNVDQLRDFPAGLAVFEQLRQTAGSVLFVSSRRTKVPLDVRRVATHGATSLEQFMRRLAVEWEPYGIRCNCLVPTGLDGTGAMVWPAEADAAQERINGTPSDLPSVTKEVAAMAVVLSSPLASFVTGARVPVNRGQILSGADLATIASNAAKTLGIERYKHADLNYPTTKIVDK